MKKTLLAALTLVAASFSLNATAQSANVRNLVDDSQVRGWTLAPNGTPSAAMWFHPQSSQQLGTNCNINITAIPVGNKEYIMTMLQIGSQAVLEQLPSQDGMTFVEMGPFQLTELDGNTAIRSITRINAQGIPLTAFQFQYVANGQLIVTTCGSSEVGFGRISPTLEHFVDQMRYGSSLISAKIENMEELEFPALLANSTDLDLPKAAANALASGLGSQKTYAVSE